MMTRLPFALALAACAAYASGQDFPTKPMRLIVPLADGDAPGLVSRRPVRGRGVQAAGLYKTAFPETPPFPSKPIRLIVPLADGDAPGLVSRRPVRGRGVQAAGLYKTAFPETPPFPSKPIRLIVPLAPGGAMDTVARAVAAKLTENLKQAVVVDNRSGAAGSIGAELTARAAPDGYTLLMASASYVTHALMYRAPYDPVLDFAPITQATFQPYILVVNPTVPAQTPGEFIALARAKPGTLNYASSGSGSFIHLTGELFRAMTKTDLVHIPYKGIGTAYPDLIAGQIQFTFASSISAMPHLKTARLRALAVTSRNRAKILPDLPALSESAVPGFDVTQWYGVLAPRGTPQIIIERLLREFAAVLRQPEIIARLAADGAEPAVSSPAQFGAHIKSERGRWAKVIKDAGIRGE